MCGQFLAGIAGLNIVEGMDVLCHCSVFSGTDLSDGLICVQWGLTQCGVFEHDQAALIMSRLWSPRSCCAREEKWLP